MENEIYKTLQEIDQNKKRKTGKKKTKTTTRRTHSNNRSSRKGEQNKDKLKKYTFPGHLLLTTAIQ